MKPNVELEGTHVCGCDLAGMQKPRLRNRVSLRTLAVYSSDTQKPGFSPDRKLLQGDRLGAESTIDLAVKGILPQAYFAALADANRVSHQWVAPHDSTPGCRRPPYEGELQGVRRISAAAIEPLEDW